MKKELEELLGREVEVEKTKDGKFVVLWMNFNSEPPPKGDTEEDAIEKFYKWFKEDSNGRSGNAGDSGITTDGTAN